MPDMANPAGSITLEKHQIPSHGLIPNTAPHGLPFTVYRSAFPASTPPEVVEKTLKGNGWSPAWRYPMYKTSHFHSTTHEALVVIAGAAELLVGGDDNPDAASVTVRRGDAMFMPVGVAHRLVREVDGREFTMVGAYPDGAEQWDMCYGREGEDDVREKVKDVAGQTVSDPVLGGALGDGA
ncbi:hypothetical protein Dda_8475 [Drechslerella dactyloides]|uniref:Cupin type-2 domain-containing protein n=1 Tax=Drechslerella dactyloides TaxID=74499 RepID=A0AAD6IQF9_DREDA|nr:hypothetical protein Dda_8475 [Drechslerella dactyloides]